MHYANGREAKNGDKVLHIQYRTPVIGVLYDAVPGNDFCNGMIAPLGGGAHFGACLADSVHLDDVLSTLKVNLSVGDVRAQLKNIPIA